MILEWRKSSFSSPDANCVEVGWRKSTYSGPQANCVEVAFAGVVGVRDSKNVPGPELSFPVDTWREFLASSPR